MHVARLQLGDVDSHGIKLGKHRVQRAGAVLKGHDEADFVRIRENLQFFGNEQELSLLCLAPREDIAAVFCKQIVAVVHVLRRARRRGDDAVIAKPLVERVEELARAVQFQAVRPGKQRPDRGLRAVVPVRDRRFPGKNGALFQHVLQDLSQRTLIDELVLERIAQRHHGGKERPRIGGILLGHPPGDAVFDVFSALLRFDGQFVFPLFLRDQRGAIHALHEQIGDLVVKRVHLLSDLFNRHRQPPFRPRRKSNR